MDQHALGGRKMILGQLHDKGSGVSGEHLSFLQDNTGNNDRCNAQEVEQGGDPPEFTAH